MYDKNLTDTFLEAYHLMHDYQMTWYLKNFGGIDPRQGQGRILTALNQLGTTRQKELIKFLDIRPQSLGELLQKLESNGYVTRYRSPTDKRSLIVEITAKGKMFCSQRPDYDEIFIGMSAKERSALKLSLQKISERLTELIDRENEDSIF